MDLAFRKNLRQSPLQQLQEIAENIVILIEQHEDLTINIFSAGYWDGKNIILRKVI